MQLQVRLTLWSVLIMAAIVTSVSALDFTEEINRQFDATVKRASSVRKAVEQTMIRNDPRLTDQLLELYAESDPALEIAVCDARGVILRSTDTQRIGQIFPPAQDFESLVKNGTWWRKLQVLLRGRRTYRISDQVGKQTVHVMVHPENIRADIMPAISRDAGISIASIFGSIFAALIFSAIAFRPLGNLGNMLDLLARGEYELQPSSPASEASLVDTGREDQLKAVVSKVSLLGERLRGKQAEISDLKDNVERLLDEMEDAVFIFGRDRRLIAAAGAVDRFLPRPRMELIGQPLAEVFPAATTLGLLLSQAVQTARPIRNRRVPLNALGDNTITIALLSVEFMELSAAGMLVRLRDPEATRQIDKTLQTADRLSAISRLTGGVAHEVKNPLNAILMHVELARMKLNHGDYDLNPQMDVISSEILRLDRVVKTFLDFTRPVALNLAEVPLQPFVDDIVDLARPQAEAAAIEVTTEEIAEPVSILADADLLKQALLNIVVNAVEAMPAGGRLRIELHVRGDDAEIRISDTGPGIPPDLRDKIYNLYFTTKERGSGIGLAMTFRIVQLHEGTIDFTGEPGKGTTFIVRIPVAS